MKQDLPTTRILIQTGRISRLSQIPHQVLYDAALQIKGISGKTLRNRLRNIALWKVGEVIQLGELMDVDWELMIDLLIAELKWQDKK